MAGFKRFEEIEAWQKARVVVREVYRACRESDVGRDFGMRDQLTRAAMSISSNIAEGFGRKSDKQFLYFLDIAHGSGCETQSILYNALDAELINQARFDNIYAMIDEAMAKLVGLANYLRRSAGKTK